MAIKDPRDMLKIEQELRGGLWIPKNTANIGFIKWSDISEMRMSENIDDIYLKDEVVKRINSGILRPVELESIDDLVKATYTSTAYDGLVVNQITTPLLDSYLFTIFNDYTTPVAFPLFYVDFCIQNNEYFLRCNCDYYYNTVGACIHLKSINTICNFVWESPQLKIYYVVNNIPYDAYSNLKYAITTRPIIDTAGLLYQKLCTYIKASSNKNVVSNEVSITAYKKSRHIEMKDV